MLKSNRDQWTDDISLDIPLGGLESSLIYYIKINILYLVDLPFLIFVVNMSS